MLLKVNTKNKNRADILEIVNIFRAKVVDLSENFKSASINIDINSGKTSFEPGFILDNGQTSIAFYTDIDFLF